MRDQIQL